MPTEFIPIAVLFWTTAILVVVILAISRIFGPSDPSPAKLMPYESGMRPFGSARRRFPLRFSLVAMLFIIFDIEVIFFYPWAVLLRDMRLYALLAMAPFLVVLLVGFFYEWKKGALNWE